MLDMRIMTQTDANESQTARSVAAPCSGSWHSTIAEQHCQWLEGNQAVEYLQAVAVHASVQHARRSVQTTCNRIEYPLC